MSRTVAATNPERPPKAMFVCHDKKIILVSVPKTGSTTLHYTMLRARGVEFFFDNPSAHLYHLFASDIDRIIGPAIRDYSVYAVVRNPYARLVSLYNDFHGRRGAIKQVSFLKFVKQGLNGKWIRDVHFLPQTRFVTRTAGFGDCSILKFETGVQTIYDEIAMRHALPRIEVGHARKGPPIGDFRQIYDPEALEIANEAYDPDFHALGYEMIAP
jgi:hypothetical protein